MVAELRKSYRRARSDAEKDVRKRVILESANKVILKMGLDNFTMNAIASAAGVAKGTLYLYFETREELLLAIYNEKFEAFFRTLTKKMRRGMSDESYCRLLLKTARKDQLLIALGARLTSIIETNVSAESFTYSKRAMRDNTSSGADRLEKLLDLPTGSGSRVLYALMALLMGAAQIDISSGVHHKDLPSDVSEIVKTASLERVFMSGAKLVFKGVRA